MQSGNIKNFFPGGNTPEGFYSFYQYLPYKTDQVYIIKGGPGTGKSTFMKKIGSEMQEMGYDIELHWCSSDNDSLDGLVIPKLGTAILDGTAPHMIDPANPGAVDDIINLGAYWDSNYLQGHKQEIIQINKLVKKRFEQAYGFLQAAKQLYIQWQGYYTAGQQINNVNKKTREIIDHLLTGQHLNNPLPLNRHLFASAFTPEGPVNYLGNLTENLKRRFIVKGEPGCGKSTIIKRVAQTLNEYGYELLYLHCPMEVKNLDALIISELDTAIIDGTSPHEITAEKDNDIIVDMINTINMDIVNKYSSEINEIKDLYQKIIEKVFFYLKEAKMSHDLMEEYYIKAMDFAAVEGKRKEIVSLILK